MGDFFRGWRRKLGVVTLLMALAFMAGWVRSMIWCDKVQWRGVGNIIHIIESNSGRWQWETISNGLLGDAAYARMTECNGTTATITGCDLTDFYSVGLAVPYKTRNIDEDASQFSRLGFEFYRLEWGDIRLRNVMKNLPKSHPQRIRYEQSISIASITVVSHWYAIIPLTLLSAYLLLGKPRKTKFTEPVPADGA